MSNIDKRALREAAEKHGDDDILALLDELEAKDKRNAELSQKADIYDMLRQDYGLQGSLVDFVDWQAKRIAELEVREVNLPKRSVGEVMHMSGFSRDYAEGWCSGNDNAIHEIHAAGLKVAAAGKGE